jgi:N-acetylglucosaminyl-diphospho-decaprenol L-rhamnosyltransferase
LSAGALALVVVTWECAEHLAALASSMNGKLDREVELIVVDNDSSDDPEAAAQRWRGSSRFARLDSNRGFGGAANAGVELARAENVVLLNPDTELLDDGLVRLAAFASAKQCLAGPRLLNPDRSVQPSAGGQLAGPWPWIGALTPGALQPRSWQRRTEPWRLESPTRVAWLSGACIAAPRALLRRLGPFDPAIHLYAEDMDLGLRAGRLGVPSFICPDLARVVHRRRGSTERRWADGPERTAAVNRRAVLRRAYGPAAERRAWWALRTNLRLRALSKLALRRDRRAELRELEAARLAAEPAPLPAFPRRSA